MMHSATRAFLWILALATAASVATGNWLMWHAVGLPERFFAETGVIAFQSVLAAAPFLIFAVTSAPLLRSHDSKIAARPLVVAALAALGLTAVFWALYFRDGYLAQTSSASGAGANIGLGMLMLFSPFVVAVPLVMGYRAARAAVGTR